MRWGDANWPIWMSWIVLCGCSRIETLTIFLARTTSWTCTGPYTVLAGWPGIVVSPAVRLPGWLAAGDNAAGAAHRRGGNSRGMRLEGQQGHQAGDGSRDREDRSAHADPPLRTRTTRSGSAAAALRRRGARRRRP